MKIKIGKSDFAEVDEELFKWLNSIKWSISSNRSGGTKYAITSRGTPKRLMHRLIMRPDKNQQIDHINGNGLDNRMINLRLCVQSENQMNRGKQSNNSTGFKGVSINKRKNNYRAFIKINRKNIALGTFSTADDAARAYDKAAMSIHGSFANTNFKE